MLRSMTAVIRKRCCDRRVGFLPETVVAVNKCRPFVVLGGGSP